MVGRSGQARHPTVETPDPAGAGIQGGGSRGFCQRSAGSPASADQRPYASTSRRIFGAPSPAAAGQVECEPGELLGRGDPRRGFTGVRYPRHRQESLAAFSCRAAGDHEAGSDRQGSVAREVRREPAKGEAPAAPCAST